MQAPSTGDTLAHHVVSHPLEADDGKAVAAMLAAAVPDKGKFRGIEAREPFNALMEQVQSRADVAFEEDAVGGVPGIWVHPPHARPDEAILHIHGGWFLLGSARAARNLGSQIAARAGVSTFIPDYRLAPEFPFPAAVDDTKAVYLGLGERGVRRIAVVGESAGGNLALVLALRLACRTVSTKAALVGAVGLSPITDLTLSGASYETRATADPFFTREQAATLVGAYLGGADPRNPLASPLYGRFQDLPPIRIHVGDSEVLLDDSRRFVDDAVAAGVDAVLHVWEGMPHGFVGGVGGLKAAGHALDAVGTFILKKMQVANRARG